LLAPHPAEFLRAVFILGVAVQFVPFQDSDEVLGEPPSPENINPEVGKRLQIRQQDGQPINAVIADMKEDTVILDANHPLAGKTLVFDIELIDIE